MHGEYVNNLLSATGKMASPEILEKLLAMEDKKEINKAIFSLETTAQALELPALKEIDEAMEIYRQERINEMVSSHEYNCASWRRDADHYFKEAHKFLKKINDSRVNLDLMSGTGNIKQQIVEILKNPFYSYLRTTNSCIQFITQPVVMTHKNPNAGIDMTVPLGRFKVEWSPIGGTIYVHRYSDNIEVTDGIIHPHVSSSGTVCLGNGSATYTRAMEKGEVWKAMCVIEAILKTYNEESPYVALSRFYHLMYRENMDFNNAVTYHRRSGEKYIYEIMCPYSALGTRRYFYNNEFKSYKPEIGKAYAKIVCVQTYTLHSSTHDGLRVNNNLYFKSKNGRYILFNNEWEVGDEQEPKEGTQIIDKEDDDGAPF